MFNDLSKFEEAVIHCAGNTVVEIAFDKTKTSAEKQVVNVLKVFLDAQVKNGDLVRFMREHQLEAEVSK